MDENTYLKYRNDLINFTLKAEGGTSDNPNDRANLFPRPKDLKVHTNKGITYETFINASKVLGFIPTNELFLKMPTDLFIKIKDKLFLEKGKKYSDNLVLSNYLGLWFWGGWNKKLMSEQKVLDIINSNVNNKTKLKMLVELRKQYFNNIVKNNPSQQVFLKGWTNRADNFYNTFNKYV